MRIEAQSSSATQVLAANKQNKTEIIEILTDQLICKTTEKNVLGKYQL